ncbi:MerR family transcriptional regulator [Herbiconiux liangxiaofengii]|uniref:MerR family transcriptional regulator n=1 Tax=Herbiconiux liangxiaofengii TaxID=3342795 RepID=UPI0035B79DF7
MRIGELASESGVSVRSLRYYEEQGLLSPPRTANGQRVYSPDDVRVVARIRDLFGAGFCSSVIRELLPALTAGQGDESQLASAFDAAAERLESEKRSIEAELEALRRLRFEFGVAPDTHVRRQPENHDDTATTHPAPPDHRDRRLR